jgi:GH25 family lysozyme M1 (1,4-beta-N-acetylmuramidase)
VEEAGYTPMVYCNMEMAVLMLDMEQLKDYDIWFAAYTDTLYYPYAYCMWQYSEKGTVDGIEGNVDLNLSFTEILSK